MSIGNVVIYNLKGHYYNIIYVHCRSHTLIYYSKGTSRCPAFLITKYTLYYTTEERNVYTPS
jgi:hypothetical protein